MLLISVIFIVIVNILFPLLMLRNTKKKQWLAILIATFLWSSVVVYELVYAHLYDVQWLLDTPGAALIEFYFIGPYYIWIPILVTLIASFGVMRLLEKPER